MAFSIPSTRQAFFLALRSGELAADAVIAGRQANNTSGEQLGSWTEEFSEGMTWIRKLVYAFYNNAFSFGEFIREHPEHRKNLTDLLVGKVFHEEAGRMFDDMEPWIEKMKAAQLANPAG